VEKEFLLTYSECVFVALAVQHVKRTCRIILSPAAYLAVPNFSTLFYKGYHLLNTKCALIFSTTFYLKKISF